MEAKVLGHDESDCGIEVVDNHGIPHSLTIQWDGTIVEHGVDEYPHDSAKRTDEEERILCQVEARARYKAQREFPDANILSPSWNADELERGLEALEKYPLSDFREQFRECYYMITDATSFVDVPVDQVQLIWQPFYVDEDNQIAGVADPALQYKDGDSASLYGDLDTGGRSETVIDITLPPYEFAEGAYEFPDGFQVFLVQHLAAKIRDCFYHMGEQPPAPYGEIEGFGLMHTCADGPIDFEAEADR